MAVAGDEQSQGHARAQALYDRYYRNVYKYALSQLRSAQDAEDAAQNTFLRAFAAMQKGVVPENEVAWLFKIAHNVCASSKLAWLRRRRVETPRDLELLPTEPEAPEPPREELAGLDGALAAMPPRLREAFLLREWQGLSYAEIAERLDTSHSAVETLIFRARRHLANELQKVQTLLLTPAAGWIRNFFGGGGAVLRGAGVVAVAAGITAAATVPSNTQPARTGPHSVRAGSAPEGALLPVSDQSRQRQRQNGTAAAPRRHTTPSRPIDVPSGGAPKTDEQLSTPEATPTTTLVTTTVARTTAQPPTQTVRSGVVATTTVVPDVTLPAATTPTVTTPSVTVPSVTTPVVTTPTLTVPPVTVPDPPHLP